MKINPPSGQEVARKIAEARAATAATAATADDVKAFYERIAAALNSIKKPHDAAAMHAAAHAAARTSSTNEAAAAGAAWQDIRHTVTPIYSPLAGGPFALGHLDQEHTPPGEGGPT